MSTNLAVGMAAAVGSAAAYGCAPLLQAIAARREPAGAGLGIALTLRLARRPIWLASLGAELLGFSLEAYAFSAAPATLVAPLIACELLVFVPLASRMFAEPLSIRGVVAIATLVTGAMLLGLAFTGNTELGAAANNAQLTGFLLGCVAIAALSATTGTRAAAAGRKPLAATLFAAGAGISYGLATLCTRQVGRTFSPQQPWHILTTTTPYVLAVCSILGVTLMQRALQTDALLAFPTMSALSALIPVIISAALLGDPVPTGVARGAFITALALIATGIPLLGRDHAAAHKHAEAHATPALSQAAR